MKRHDLLIPFSRDHHGGLLLAQLMKKNAPAYRGMPADMEGKRQYAISFYAKELKPHFEAEEQMFMQCLGLDTATDRLIKELFEEHFNLTQSFDALIDQKEYTDLMDSTGRQLEAHIRKEERVFFPLLETWMEKKTGLAETLPAFNNKP